jgi:ribosome-associated heat shock protein Hsp15
MPDQEVRMDKFLWAVRIYKTRTLAAEACSKGQVVIDNIPVKPSRHVKSGEIIFIRKSPILHSYKVLEILHSRLPAEKVKNFIVEITPEEEFNKIEMLKLQQNAFRDRGTGRPTKRDRREIDKHRTSH